MTGRKVFALAAVLLLLCAAAAPPALGAFTFRLEKDVPFSLVPAAPLPIAVHIFPTRTASAPVVSEKIPLSNILISQYSVYGGEAAYRLRLDFTETDFLASHMDLYWELEMNGVTIGRREKVPQSAYALFATEALLADSAADADRLGGLPAGAFSIVGHTHITGGALAVSLGGTGSTTPDGARANLGAAALSHTHDGSQITSGELPDGRLSANVAMQSDLTALQAQITALTNQLTIFQESTVTAGYPELIEFEDLGDARKPDVAMDSSGNAVAAWSQISTGGVRSLFTNRYTAGVGWGGTTVIESDNTGNTSNAAVAVDGAGNGIAVWEQFMGAANQIFASHYTTASGTWSASPVRLDIETASGSVPQVAVDPAGNAIAVWEQHDGGDISIWANRYIAGGTWQGALLLEESDAGAARVPQVAMDPAGNAVAVWNIVEGGVESVKARLYPAGSPWASVSWSPSPWETLDDGNGPASYAQVGMDGSGNALVVWEQLDGTGFYHIYSNRYTAGTPWQSGSWSGAAAIDAGSDNATGVQIAVSSSGDAAAAWTQTDGTFSNAWANTFSASGGTWGGAQLLESRLGHATKLEVATNASDDAVAVWQQTEGSVENAWASRFTPGSGWGAPKLLETESGTVSKPRVSMDPSGNAMAIWQQSDGIRDNIRSNLF